MSEYQYYEFLAIDRKLNEKQMGALRDLSTRAHITPTSFTNEYNFGDFRGRPEELMERYFDAHLYLANWGSHRLMLRLPRRLLDEKTAKLYCAGRLANARRKGDFVILDFNAEEDSGNGEWEAGNGWLASLISIRADLLRADHRALYLGWLLCVQGGEVDDDALEPPVPPELRQLSATLERFAEFLRIDPALIEVAAERRLEEKRRTASALLAAARARADDNRRRAESRQAAALALTERKEAQARRRRLATLRKDEPAAWRRVDAFIAAKEPSSYDQAVKLLGDLRDLAVDRGKADLFGARLKAIRMQHRTKSALLRRINAAGLQKNRTVDDKSEER
jgi:hypothetical protein